MIQDNATDFAKNNTANATFTVSGSEGSYKYTAVVKLKQQQDEWQSGAQDIGGVTIAATDATKGGTATIEYDQTTNQTTITMS